MKKWLIMFLLLLSVGANAQVLMDSVSVAELTDGKQIWGKTLALEKPIRHVIGHDSLIAVVTCDTTKSGRWKDEGSLFVVETGNMDVLWKKSLDLSMCHVSDMTKHGVLLATTLKSTGKSLLTLKDRNTGESRWTQYICPVFVSDSLDIVIGLEKTGSSNTFAYRLHDGVLLWNVDIPMSKNIGWSKAVMVDSSHMMVVGDDINLINVKTGQLQKIKAKTGISDSKGIAQLALLNVLSVGTGIAFGSSFIYYYYNLNPYTITGLTSNILRWDSCAYISDRNNLYRLGVDSLSLEAKYEFPGHEASTARLMMKNGKVFMLNYGYGYSLMRGNVKCGKPFLAVFDGKTLNQEKFLPLYDKKHIMNDGLLNTQGVFLAGGDKAVYLSFQDSSICTFDSSVKKYGSLYYIPRTPLYGYHGNPVKLTLLQANEDVCPMLTSKNKVCLFDCKMSLLDSYEDYETFYPCFKSGNVICVQNNKDKSNYWLIRPDGSAYAKIKWTPNSIYKASNSIIVVYRNKLASFVIR